MITYLPSPSFKESAQLLTDEQLEVQVVDCLKILDALDDPTTQHLSVVMWWKGHGFALVTYAVAMCDEIIARGHECPLREVFLERVAFDMQLEVEAVEAMLHQDILASEPMQHLDPLPKWLGGAIHAEHRKILGTLALEPKQTKENRVSDDVNLTREGVVDALRAAGYDGPVSYTKTRLLEMLETVKAGGTIEVPKRGRRSREASDAEGTPAEKATAAA